MTESDSYNISDRLRSRSGRHGGTGDSNMGNTESKAEARSSSASNVANDDAWTQPLYKYLVCASSGFVFGFAMEKGRVHEPAIIRDMMVMKNFTMLKMFLSAVSAGMLSMVILATYPGTRRRFLKVCDDFYKGMSCKSVTSSALGGLIIGIGMPISGSCPTSVFVQLGSFCPNAFYTILGGLVSTLAYGFLKFDDFTKPSIEESIYTILGGLVSTLAYGFLKPMFDDFTKPSIEESSNPWTDSPYYAMAMPITLMFAGLVSAFEMLVPWTTEVQVTGGNAEYGVLSMRAWPPWVAGMIVGAIQIPLILGISQTLGGTSSLVTFVSQVFVGPLKSISTPFLNAHKKGFSNWWQVFYVTGAMGGAFTSAYLSGSLGDMTGVSTTQAFSGGVLLMLGARIAGGCTSGHGITGMGFMSILSLIATASMFGGGMATGFSMKYILGAY